MDNYLSPRWPKGPGVQPPPLPTALPGEPVQKPRRGMRRWMVSAVSIVLVLALLGGVSFWAVNAIAGMIAQSVPTIPDDLRPWASRHLEENDSGWTPDDLPWGDPDPSVELSPQPAGAALTGRDLYQAALPTLVCVETTHSSPFEGSVGTGVVVDRRGYVITNYHIIDEAVKIDVELLDGSGRPFSAKVIGFDEEFDLAVLKFDPKDTQLTPARLGDSDQLAVGDWVYAVGNPMGYLLGSMSVGIVSALDRDEDRSGSALGLIQVSNPLNPGNSGGALLNEYGQVVGITCAKVTGMVWEHGETINDAVVLEGIGLAIPISDAIPFLNHILATGKTWRPAMGIRCQAAQLDGRKGIRVAEVTSAAAREAGLRENDLILSANGVPVTSLVELRRVLYRTGVDGELTCTVLRNGTEHTVTFPLMDSMAQN